MSYKEEDWGWGPVSRGLKQGNDSLLLDAGWERDKNNGKIWISPGGTGYPRTIAVKKMKDKRRRAAKRMQELGITQEDIAETNFYYPGHEPTV